MYNVSEKFIQALNEQRIQHMRGKLHGKDVTISFSDRTIFGVCGNLHYEKQCVQSADTFNIGEMYIGSVTVPVNFSDAAMRNGYTSVELEFGFEYDDGTEEYIPLGKWDIKSIVHESTGIYTIVGEDCTAKLDVPIADNTVGNITLRKRIERVKKLTGIEFAQTFEELSELAGTDLDNYWGTSFCRTCREEIIDIAQIIGGFAYADRQNKLAFRKFGGNSIIEIDENQRFECYLNDKSEKITGVAYLDKFGNTDVYPIYEESGTIISFSDNVYVWDNIRDPDYQWRLSIIGENLRLPEWNPGEIKIYGNPALDLGDIVKLKGGSVSEPKNFIITVDSWQYRGAQTLISGSPASQNHASSTGDYNVPVSQNTITKIEFNNTKSMTVIDGESYPGEVTSLREVAEVSFSLRSQNAVFVYLSVILTGISKALTEIHVLFDGVMQTVFSSDSIGKDERKTISFSVPLTAESGLHSVSVEMFGSCTADRISLSVSGQDISAEQSENTFSFDYKYHIADGAFIDEYVGDSVNIRIPHALSGKTVKTLGNASFSESKVEFVKIPDGVEVIL